MKKTLIAMLGVGLSLVSSNLLANKPLDYHREQKFERTNDKPGKDLDTACYESFNLPERGNNVFVCSSRLHALNATKGAINSESKTIFGFSNKKQKKHDDFQDVLSLTTMIKPAKRDLIPDKTLYIVVPQCENDSQNDITADSLEEAIQEVTIFSIKEYCSKKLQSKLSSSADSKTDEYVDELESKQMSSGGNYIYSWEPVDSLPKGIAIKYESVNNRFGPPNDTDVKYVCKKGWLNPVCPKRIYKVVLGKIKEGKKK